MIEAILFDLDDTLLENDIHRFLKSYLPLVAEYTEQLLDRNMLMAELMYGTQAMMQNSDAGSTNREVFWSVFSERTGVPQEAMEPVVTDFYRERFGELRPLTAQRPAARMLVRYCLAKELKVVIATNPVFPLAAIEQRLEWAGISPDGFRYELVTGYEDMHFTKPHIKYYEEILRNIGVDADRALMVGDDWENDITPAGQLGLHTFWINYDGEARPDGTAKVDGVGTLEEFYDRLSSGRLLAG
jgi:HAD superfamily hydrolase (TIGR01549 family)